MTRTNMCSRTTLKMLLIALTTAALGKAYLWYFGLPPYYGLSFIYPGKPDSQLVAEIDSLMLEIRNKYPDPTLRMKVRRVAKDWPRTAKRPGLALAGLALGLGALPYVEEMTRSGNPQERRLGYNMLLDFSIAGAHESGGEPTGSKRDLICERKYLDPIWQRALYDPLPDVRQIAIKKANLGTAGISVYCRMLRDPDKEVQVAAARRLMGSHYNRPDLVPKYLQYLSKEAGVE